MNIQYRFASLEALAQFFEESADQAAKRADRASTQRDKLLERREVYAWKQAAHVVRSTTLTEVAP